MACLAALYRKLQGQEGARTGPGGGQDWAMRGPGGGQDWARRGPGGGQDWARRGPRLGQDWDRRGPGLGQEGARTGPENAILLLIRIFLQPMLLLGIPPSAFTNTSRCGPLPNP